MMGLTTQPLQEQDARVIGLLADDHVWRLAPLQQPMTSRIAKNGAVAE